jgi:hypothetical protein
MLTYEQGFGALQARGGGGGGGGGRGGGQGGGVGGVGMAAAAGIPFGVTFVHDSLLPHPPVNTSQTSDTDIT